MVHHLLLGSSPVPIFFLIQLMDILDMLVQSVEEGDLLGNANTHVEVNLEQVLADSLIVVPVRLALDVFAHRCKITI